MITGFLLVLGGLIGAACAEEVGAVAGAFIGYCFGHWLSESRKADRVEARLREVEAKITLLQTQRGVESRAPSVPTTETIVVALPGGTIPEVRQPTSDGRPPTYEVRAPISDVRQPRIAGPNGGEPGTGEPGTVEPQNREPQNREPQNREPQNREPQNREPQNREPQNREPTTAAPRSAPAAAASAPTIEMPGRRTPNPIDLIRTWFFGGNTVVRVGVIILLFGVGFLLKYAADHEMFPVEARLACAALLGIALIALGFRLRNNRLSYAVSLQGGGIGIIYLVTFGAYKIYHFIPSLAAMGIFVALIVFTGMLSVLQDAMALAVLGIIGGFLAPILASTGSGDFVALFTYYAILNAGILGLAWFKSWRVLNLVGFTFTFVIGTLWGINAYKPENYAATQFFLALFFVFYAAIAVIYALRRPTQTRGFVDGTLTFGLPAIAFALQVGLVKDTPWGLAISAVIVAFFYIGIATLVWQRSPQTGRQLAEAFTAIGVVFATMALPFALNAQWTAAAYALEGAGLVWVGRRQKKPLAEAAGVLLQFAAGLAFDSPGSAEANQPVIDRVYPYAALRAIGAFASAYFLRTRISLNSTAIQTVLVIWALGWLTGGVAADCAEHGVEWHLIAIMVSAAAAHHLLVEVVSQRLAFKPGRLSALLLAPVLLVLFCVELAMRDDGVRVTYTWVAWPLAVVAWLVIIKRLELQTPKVLVTGAYMFTPSLVALLLSALAYRYTQLAVPEGVWDAATMALVPSILLFTIASRDKAKGWPLTTHGRAILIGAAPLVVFVVFWSFSMSFSSSGNPAPLAYIPLLTPLDVTQAILVVATAAWVMRLRLRDEASFAVFRVPLASVLVAVLFVHLSAVCVRSVHFYSGVPWDSDDLAASQAVQATLSIAWTVIALVVTTLASRKHWRAVWMVGGALLAVVVLKLFLVDLSTIGTGTRIISFIVVGLLLLLIGWISPVRPGAQPPPQSQPNKDAMLTLALTLLVTQAPENHVVVHREDFAYGARLQTEPGKALQSLVLPENIYDALTRSDAGDIAVFNASGAQVPHAFRRASETVQTTDVKLPVFPLKGASGTAPADMQITVEHAENGAVTTVKTTSVEQNTLLAYFVDLTSVTLPVRSITFKFRDGEDSFVQHFNIEAGDDLAYWRTISYGVTVASLMHDGHRIARETIETAPFTAKYLRITWNDTPPQRTLDQVIVTLSGSITEPQREWAGVGEVQNPRPGAYRFHLNGFRPVDRIKIQLPEDNTLAEATLASATSTDGAWFTRYSGLIYRLDSKGIDEHVISLADVADPYWQLEVSSAGGGIGTGVPVFQVGWEPHELLFVARGEGPFVLAYGNANTAVAAFDPEALATMARTEGGEAVGNAMILDAKVELGGAGKLTPEPPDATLPLRRIILWASLGAAVLLLGWMSVRLFRQLGT